MSKVFCPSCETQEAHRKECTRCDANGYLMKHSTAEDGSAYVTKVRCPKCKGSGMINYSITIKNEMTFVHFHEDDPIRWVCRKCNYQIYLPTKGKPEEQLPPVDTDAELKNKDSQETVRDFIRKKFHQ